MHIYSPEQLNRYFTLLSLSDWESLLAQDARGFFDRLVKRQLARMTYNMLSLHYSTDKSGSLDPEVLFDKIVDRDRGGYCFELNVFFLHIIRSLGFEVMAVGCRMRDQKSTSHGLDRWRTTSHMAMTVLVNNERLLVDVGCGIQSPVTPLLLSSGQTATGLTGQEIKVELKRLTPTSMSAPVWIYSMRHGGADHPWKEIYAFPDAEFLSSDFDVLNYYTLHASPFTRIVVAQSIFFEDSPGGTSGTLSLVNNRITQSVRGEDKVIATLQSERERVDAFAKYFGLSLSAEEQAAMEGSAYALGDSGGA